MPSCAPLQPENILCGDRIVDIKLADFGLSHLVNPHERMMMACGTLSYVGEYWQAVWGRCTSGCTFVTLPCSTSDWGLQGCLLAGVIFV